MNPYSDKDRPAGADILPTVQDIAPAPLNSPAPQVADASESLESQLPSLNGVQTQAPVPMGYESEDGYHRFGRRRLVLAGAVLAVGLLSGLGLGLAAYVQHATKQQPPQTDLSNVNLKAPLTADNQKQTLHINYDAFLDNGKTLTATGSVIIQNDQTAGFSVQNAGGGNLLVVDTARGKVGVGQAPTGNARLQVNGDVSVNGSLLSVGGGYSLSNQGLSLNGVLVCTAAGCTNQTVDLSPFARLAGNNSFSGINKFTAAGNVFVGDGSGLSALDAGNVSSGTLSDSRLSNNVALANGNNSFTGTNTFTSQIQASGGINASAYVINGTAGASFTCPSGQLLQQAVIQGGIITGGSCVPGAGASVATLQEVYDASSPANIVLSGANGKLQVQDAASPLAGNLFEVTSNGAVTTYFAVNSLGISVTGNVNTTGQYQVSGVQISSANLSNDANLAKVNGNTAFTGNNTFSSALNSFTGSGSGLTALNASNISSGTLNDARLSNNVALLNAAQTFAGANIFSNAANSFTGSGAGLTSLNAANISSGTLNDLRLSNNVTLAGNTFNGANQLVQLTAGGILPILNGSNLTALNASNISSGTLSDARLSANVALLSANNIFLGDNSFHLNSAALSVQDAASPLGADLFTVANFGGGTKYFEVSAAGAKVNGNDVCTAAGNCTGVSGGAVGGSGTAGTISVFTGSGFTIGDSLLSQSGSTVAVNGSINIAAGNTYQVGGVQISSANLSNDANLAKLNAAQTFTGANTFSNAGNSFTGDGTGLTNVNAAKLNGQAGSFYQNASNLNAGTLSDARLSNNVALLNANNGFTGNNTFTLNTAGLAVQDAASPLGTNLFEVDNNDGSTKYFTVSATALQFLGEDVCTTGGNCAGVAGIGGSGTAGKIAKFTGSGLTIGDSLISDNGTTVTVGGILGVNTITPTATLTVGTASQTLTLQGDASTSLSASSGGFTNSLVFALPAVASHTITVPNASGTVAVSASGPLALDAAGNLSCPTCATTGSGVTSVNTLTGAITLAGTAKQIIITPAGNTLTFSTPQDIDTTSSPQFANVNVTGQFQVGGSQISSANLSNDANLAKLNGAQTFTGANTFSNAGNSFTGDGSGLTSLNASNISSGTLNDARLSTNVALLNANNSFTGNNNFVLNTAGLAVQDAASPLGTDLFEVTDNAGTTKYFTVSATALQFLGNDVCTTAGNCTGVSGGSIGGSGTAGKIAKFTGSGFTIGDSLISDNGTTVTVGGILGVNTITPTATLTVGTSTQTLALQGDASTSLSATSGSFTNSLVFAAPAVASHTITVPNASGTVAVSASGPLSLDAAGNLSCPTCLTSGGGSGVSSVNTLTGAITLAGTANQIIITPAGNTLTFSTPQDIDTTSSVDFANVNVTGQFQVGGSQISSGDLSDSASITKQGNVFNGNNQLVQTDGSGKISNSNLNTDVALTDRAGGQTFTTAQTFSNTITAPGITAGGAALGIGASGDTLNLNGTYSSSLVATDGTNSTTIGFAGVPVGDVVYDFDVSATAGTYTICTTANNCAGLGGGVSTSSNGTSGTIAMFTGTQTIANSALTQTGSGAGSTVTAAGTLDATTLTQGGTNVLLESTSFSGDVSGTFNALSLDKIGGTTLTVSALGSGQFLQYDGTAWVNHSISGDITINSSGAATIGVGAVDSGKIADGSIANIDIAAAAAIADSKLAQITSANKVADSALSANVTKQGNIFNGNNQLVQTDGSAHISNTNLNTDVALTDRAGGQTFTTAQTFSNTITAPGVTAGGAALGIGASGDTLNLNGTYSSSLAVTDGTNTTTIAFSGVPVGDVVYDFDVAAAAGTYTICTSAGNCTGVAGGSIGGSGTANKLAKFTGSGFTIGDSILTDNGTTVSVAGTLDATTLQQGGTNVLLETTAFSGDVSGVYNNLSLDKIAGTTLTVSSLGSGNFLQYNGTAWVNHSITGDITVNSSGAATIASGAVDSGKIADGTIANIDIAAGAAIDYSKLNLNASIQDSDVAASSHFAFTNANNTFTGNNTFTLNTAGLAVQDAASPLGTELFEVTDNAGTTKYFTVSATALQFLGNDVCTAAGNCVGVSGGAIGGSGTAGKIAKFTGSGFTVGDSLLSDDGTTVTVGGDAAITGSLDVSTITSSATLTIGVPTQTLTLQGDGSTSLSATVAGVKNSLVFAAPTVSGKTITIPDASGTVAVSASGPLALDAAGNLSCPTCLTSGGGSGVSSVNSLSGAITLAGTANQIIITPASNTLTFSTPQDINTTSNVNFGDITSSGTFNGNGSGLTNVDAATLNGQDGTYYTNASNINSGTLGDSFLSSNVPLKNAANTFTNTNTVAATNAAAFQIQSALAADTLLTADSTARNASGGNLIKIGNNTGTEDQTTVLVTDSFNGTLTSDLGALNGGLYYNTGTGHINVIENGAVKELCNKTDLGCGSSAPATTLAGSYTNGTSQTDETLLLDSTRNGVLIRDKLGGLGAGATLFGVQDSTGGTKYLDVTAGGIAVAGTAVATGNINTSGGTIQTAGTDRIDNTGNLTNIGNFTASAGSVFSTTGANGFTFKPGTDNALAFQIQNAAGNSLLTADTSNTKLTLAANTTVGTLYGNRLFSDDFESGNLNLWNSTSGSQPTVQASTVHAGKYATQFTPGAGTPSYAQQSLIPNSTAYLRAWVYVASQAASSTLTVAGLDNGQGNGYEWQIQRNSTTGQICVLNTHTSTSLCGGSFTTGVWHEIELQITQATVGTGTTNLWMDGASIASSSTEDNGTPAVQISRTWVGDRVGGVTGTFYADDISVDASARPSTSSSLNVQDTLHVGGSATFGNAVLVNVQSPTAFRVVNAYGQNAFNIDNTNSGNIQNGTTTISTTQTVIKAFNDTTGAFQIQNATGSQVLNVDTSNSRVTLNGDTSVGSLYDGVLFSDNFESGNTSLWSQHPSDGVTSIETSTVHGGKYALQFVNTGSGSSGLATHINGNTVFYRAWVNVASQTTAQVNILGLTNGGNGNTWDVQRNTAGQLCFAATCGGNFSLGSWHLVEIQVTQGNPGITNVWLDGTSVYSSSTDNNGTFAVQTAYAGDNSASQIVTGYIDDVSITTTRNSTSSSLNVSDTLNVQGSSVFKGEVVIQPPQDEANIFRVASASGGGLLNIGSSNGVTSLSIGAQNTTITPSSNSATAFQVQNAAGSNLINVDTSNNFVINNGTSTPNNQLQNPGFESGTASNSSGWTLSAGASINNDSNARSGNKELTLAGNSTNYEVYTTKYYLVNPGDTVDIQAWIKNSAGTNGQVRLEVRCYDSNYNWGATFAGAAINPPGTSYALKEFTYTNSVCGAAYMAVGLMVQNNSTTGTWYVDDMLMNVENNHSPAIFQNSVDSATAFQVQNAAGAGILTVDSTNQRVSVGGLGTATGQLYVGGNVPTAATGSVSTGAGSSPEGVAMQGNYAYVINYTTNTLQVIDVTNPAAPAVISTTSTGAVNPSFIDVKGSYAYITTAADTSLQVWNIANPGLPVKTGSVTLYTQGSVHVQGQYAYVAVTGGLQIVDVSNPSAPRLVNTVASAANFRDVAVVGSYAYVTASDNTLKIFNIANPLNVSQVSSTATATSGVLDPYVLTVQGRYAYVSNYTANKIQVFDVSNPASPVSGTTVSTTSPANRLQIRDRMLYALEYTGNRFQIFDISNPAAPASAGSVSVGTNPSDMTVSGRFGYVTNEGGNTMQVFDLGGAYIQQFEAGSAEIGHLNVDGDTVMTGNTSIQGSLNVGGGGIQTAGSLGVAGNAVVQGNTLLGGGSNGLSVPLITSFSKAGACVGSGFSYYYSVQAVNAAGGETTSDFAIGGNFGCSATSAADKITVHWSAVSGAAAYKVYRTSTTGTDTAGYIGTTTGTSFDDVGQIGSGSTPTIDTTKQLSVLGSSVFQTSTNTTTAFQIQNSSTDNILSVDTANSRISVNSSFGNLTAKPTQNAASTSSTGGSLPAATYYYKITAIDGSGGESLPSNEQSIVTTGSTSTVTLSWNPVVKAAGYKIYRSTSTNAEVYLTTTIGIQNGAAINYTDTGSITPGTATVPASSNYYYNNANLNNANSALQLSVGGYGTATGQVYISGTVPSTSAGYVPTAASPVAIAAQGRYIYVAETIGSNKFEIYDASSPQAMVLIKSVALTGAAGYLTVAGHYLYIAVGNTLVIYDVSNPASPTLVSTTTVTTGLSKFVVQGRLLFAIDTGKSLRVFDVASPAAIASLGSVAVSGNGGLFVQGRYAYVTGGSSANTLQVVDVSNPAAPSIAGAVGTGTTPTAIQVAGRYAYVANQGSNNLQIFDISNPAAPTAMGQVSISGTTPVSIAVQGRFAYLTNQNGGAGGQLQVIDVSNPAAPAWLGGVGANLAYPSVLVIDGRYAYVGDINKNYLVSFDLGGTYTQQLEAGGAEFGTLQVDSNGQVAGDFNIQGGLSVGQSLQAAGNVGIGGGLNAQGSVMLSGGNNQLGAPAGTPTVGFSGTPGGSAVTWSYVVTAINATGGESRASAAGSITAPAASNSTLSGTNFNTISWSAVAGASGYKVYRTAATGGTPSTTGYIGTTTSTSFNDTGLTGAGNFAPTTDTTGQLTVLGSSIFKTTTNSTTAFQVQNANGDALLTADTSNTRLILNADTTIGTSYDNELFSDNFESGSTSVWDTRGGEAGYPETTTVHNGKYAEEFDLTGSGGSYLETGSVSLGAPTTEWVRAWVYVASQDSSTASATVMTLSDGSGNGHDWNVEHTQSDQICVINSGTDTTNCGDGFTKNTWHLVELEVTQGTSGNTQLWLDGTSIYNDTQNNGPTGGFERMSVGDGDVGDEVDFFVDDVVASTIRTSTSASLNVQDGLHVGGVSQLNRVIINPSGVDAAFQIQNSDSSTEFQVNTADRRIGFGTGDTSGSTFHFYDSIGSAADLVDFGANCGVDVFSLDKHGDSNFKTCSNSTTAFQVQDASGTNFINLDSTDGILTLGNAFGLASYASHKSVSPSSGLSVTSGSFSVSGTSPALIINIALNDTSQARTITGVSWSLGSGTPYEVKNVRNGNTYVSVWAVPAPVAGSGTYTVNISGTGTPDYQIDAQVFNNVDQTTPAPTADAVSTTGNNVSSLTLTPANLTSNDASSAVGGLTVNGDPTGITPNNTYLNNTTAINIEDGYGLGTGSLTANFGTGTGQKVAMIAIRLKAAVSSVSTNSTAIQGGAGGIQLTPAGTGNTGVVVKPLNNSMAAFQVQNAAGSSLLTADTVNQRISIGNSGTPTGQLYVGGSLPASWVYQAAISGVQDVKIQGHYAYVVSYNLNNLYVYDIADPANPVLVSTTEIACNAGSSSLTSPISCNNTAAGAQAVYVAGRYAYIAEYGSSVMTVYDVSIPTAPVLVGTPVSVGSNPNSVYVYGGYAYTGNYGSASTGLSVINVVNPYKPAVTTLNIGVALYTAQVDGSYLYTYSTSGVLNIYNISNPTAPALSSSTATGGSACGAYGPNDIYVSGHLVYAIDCSNLRFRIYDVSNPASPVLKSTTSTTSTGPRAIIVQGRTAYMSLQNSIAAFDVSNPSAPVQIGSNFSTYGGVALAVNGRYLYAADEDNSKFSVYDIGGTYSQSLQAGSIQAGNLNIAGTSTFNGAASFQSGANIDQGLQVNGAVGIGGPNSTTAFQVQNASGGSLISVDSTNGGAVTVLGNNSPELGNWTTTTQVSPGGSADAADGSSSVVVNGYIYVIGGPESTSGNKVRFARLNANGSIPATGQPGAWTTTTTLNYNVTEAGVTSYNGYIYVIGGSTDGTNGGATGNVQYGKVNADGTISAWKTISGALCTDNTATTAWGPGAVALNGYLYSIGGLGTSGVFRKNACVSRINPDGSLGTFNLVTAAQIDPTNGIAFDTAITANGYIYAAGGVHSGNNSRNVYYAKPSSTGDITSWSVITNALPAAKEQAALFVANGYLYAITGGSGVSGTSASATQYYAQLNADGSIAGNTFSSTANVTGVPSLLDAAWAQANGYFYILGGSNGTTAQSTVYYTSGARLKVGGALDLVGLGGEDLSSTGGTGGSLTAGNTRVVGTLDVQNNSSLWGSLSVQGNISGSGLVALQPAASLVGGQNAIAQTFTNGDTTGGIVSGDNQNITISTTTAGGTTNGVNITLTESSTQTNVDNGIKITLAGGNSNASKYGANITLDRGVGAKIATNGFGSAQNCVTGISGSISAGICAESTTINANTGATAGVIGSNLGSTNTVSLQAAAGAGIYGVANPDPGGTGGVAGNNYVGIKGQAIPTANAAYNSIGVYGDASGGGTNANLYGGYFTLQNTGSSASTALFASNGTTTNNILTLQDGTATSANVLTVADEGATKFQNRTDSSAAFQVQRAGSGAVLFTIDTQNSVIKIAGDTTTFVTLQVDNGHFKSTQTNAPAIGMTTCVGTPAMNGTGATGATDSAGSFTTGSLSTGGSCVITVTFNKAYANPPKSVIVTPKGANAAGMSAYVSSTTANTFVVTFTGSAATSTAYDFYYWVIE